ncbi:porin [Janthinobacterium sp. HLX7-2]|uniref:porin n=1 Tax=Janthinobacterium sp. HLX7-2 TaxID=1259331 RepID=UPI003F211640
MNKITRSAVTLLGSLCASTAMAQSSVTVYGIVDSGLAYMTNANAAGDSVTKVPSLTGSFPSRLGFRGVEDLGDGLQAVFVLENGFGVDTGSIGQGGRLFGRQANVGLKGAFGTITLGRQVNMSYIAPMKADVLGPNLFAIGSIDAYLPNARSDNAIGYLGVFSGVTVGATYSFGRDASAAGGPSATGCAGEVAGNAKACRQVTGMLAYDSKEFGVSTSYDVMNGNVGAAGGLTSSDNTDKRATLNAYAMLGQTKIGAGVVDRKTRAATGRVDSDLYYLGVSHPLTPALILDAQVAYRDTKASSSDVGMLVARVTYFLSKRTAVYTSIGQMKNKGASAVSLDAGGTVGVGKTQNGLMGGLRHTF